MHLHTLIVGSYVAGALLGVLGLAGCRDGESNANGDSEVGGAAGARGQDAGSLAPGETCSASACPTGSKAGNAYCPDGTVLSRTECSADAWGKCGWQFAACEATPPTCETAVCQQTSGRDDDANVTVTNHCWSAADRTLSAVKSVGSSQGTQLSLVTSVLDEQNHLLAYCQYLDGAPQFCNRYTRNAQGAITSLLYEFKGVAVSTTEYRTLVEANGIIRKQQQVNSTGWTTTEVMVADASGRIGSSTSYNGAIEQRSVQYNYDTNGTLVGEVITELDNQRGPNSTNQYLTSSRHYVYDAAGRLVELTIVPSSGPSTTLSYTYNPTGGLQRYDSSIDGAVATPRSIWTYDGARLLAQESWADAGKNNDAPSYVTRYTEVQSADCAQYQAQFPGIFAPAPPTVGP